MPTAMSANLFNVKPGEPAFIISTNLCDYFEIGSEDGGDCWLKGEIVGPEKEFVFNGRLFLPTLEGGEEAQSAGVIFDNFPKSPTPTGWTRRQTVDQTGYDLVDTSNNILFGYKTQDDGICRITINVYAEDGTLVAESTEDTFLIHRGPALIGRGGIRLC